jgi:hypothetical protein
VIARPLGASIPGTIIFDGDQAQKGYALYRMCFSFNSARNRAAFLISAGWRASAPLRQRRKPRRTARSEPRSALFLVGVLSGLPHHAIGGPERSIGTAMRL